jgi:hypothetical protein
MRVTRIGHVSINAAGDLDERGIPYLDAGQGAVGQVFITDPAGNTIELQRGRLQQDRRLA